MEYCKNCGRPCKCCVKCRCCPSCCLCQPAFFSVKNNPVREKSPLPAINSILESDGLITGNGIPGATIEVTFPDGTKSTATVNGSGLWLTILPSVLHLTAGQTVSAAQTVTGQSPSAEAVTAVI